MDKARRYNTGKLRYELISPYALEELAKVYTLGAEKYTIRDGDGNIIDDGANNWRKGLSWTEAIGSVKRHLQAFEKGEDVDELGSLHLANAAWGLFSILEYYKTHPELDDRIHRTLSKPRITLDIDDVCADFFGVWCKKYGIDIPCSSQFDRAIQ